MTIEDMEDRAYEAGLNKGWNDYKIKLGKGSPAYEADLRQAVIRELKTLFKNHTYEWLSDRIKELEK